MTAVTALGDAYAPNSVGTGDHEAISHSVPWSHVSVVYYLMGSHEEGRRCMLALLTFANSPPYMCDVSFRANRHMSFCRYFIGSRLGLYAHSDMASDLR